MKKLFNAIVVMLLTVALLLTTTGLAANFRANSFLLGQTVIYSGTNSLTRYASTSTTAYDTNVFYTNSAGTIIYNGSTNSATSAINGWSQPIQLDCDPNTGTIPQASIAVALDANGNTNKLTFTFTRSVDGTYYDTNLNTFSFTTPVNSSGTTYATITNIPTVFLYGAKYIRLDSILVGTNITGGTSTTTGTNYTTLRSVTFNSFYP